MGKAKAQDQSTLTDPAWSVRMADSALARYALPMARWHYEHGLLLKSIEQVWRTTGQDRYWRFVQDVMEVFVEPDGNVRMYRVEEYNLDQVNPGKVLFPLYRETGDVRYKKAIDLVHRQLQGQPRTHSGGFWHKKIYPYQIWLDGVYMAGPFIAEYARMFNEPAGFDDVTHEFSLVEQHMRDAKTGLLYHGWDESRQQRWADPVTGCSPHFWGRGIGWYAMALVDVLDFLPDDHPYRPALIDHLVRLVEAVTKVQDPASGVWYQVVDQGARDGNYLESSASCMFVYAMAKGVRKGYLPGGQLVVARRGFQGILEQFVRLDDQGLVNLERVCAVAGLGGNPYRDGSYEYYVGERIATNDYKGVGPFILAAIEIEGSHGGGTHRSQPAR